MNLSSRQNGNKMWDKIQQYLQTCGFVSNILLSSKMVVLKCHQDISLKYSQSRDAVAANPSIHKTPTYGLLYIFHCLFQINFHFIQIEGHHEAAFAILYYITYL